MTHLTLIFRRFAIICIVLTIGTSAQDYGYYNRQSTSGSGYPSVGYGGSYQSRGSSPSGRSYPSGGSYQSGGYYPSGRAYPSGGSYPYGRGSNYYYGQRKSSQRKSSPPIGFTVAKTADQEFTSDGKVTFEKVITNVGKAFDAAKNVVRIPVTGLYYFSFFAQTNTTDGDNLELAKNYDTIVSAMGLNAANAAVVFCKKGDILTLKARTGTVLLSSEENIKVTFSSFLIQRFDDKTKTYTSQ